VQFKNVEVSERRADAKRSETKVSLNETLSVPAQLPALSFCEHFVDSNRPKVFEWLAKCSHTEKEGGAERKDEN
jgi:hypothetical protein